jgi:hypothetical protein
MLKSKVYSSIQDHENNSEYDSTSNECWFNPIVPYTRRQTEFVPLKYHFHTLEQAAHIVSLALISHIHNGF